MDVCHALAELLEPRAINLMHLLWGEKPFSAELTSNSDDFLECPYSRDEIKFLLNYDPSTPLKSIASILEGFIDDPLFKENDDLFDLECKMNDWKRILYDAPIDEAECFDPGCDNDEIDAFLAIKVPTYIEEGYYDSARRNIIILRSLSSDDTPINILFRLILYTIEFTGETYHDSQELLENTRINQSMSIALRIKFHLPRSTEKSSYNIEIFFFHHLIFVKDSDSNKEEIDIFSGPDDSIPPRTKKLYDSKIKNRIFDVGDRVLLFNSRLKIFSGKLKTRWSGPFTITKVFQYGTIELSQSDGPNFKVNGHRVKHYFGGDIPPKVVQDLHTLSKDERIQGSSQAM
ncbi:hypothetical protein Tco_1094460 [Tanacetum coccineum]|uniref:Reverse transcriptase domain-containing protein n=1 Tax=Tanacetum coccineum TaxID=301880 RepID=A0ABQ5IFR5_9ASTR